MSVTHRITPFLWFDTEAEEAANFYCSIFKNSKIAQTVRYGDTGPGPKGSVMIVNFEIDGAEFTALNGGPRFKFDEAISFVVHCETQEEIDYYWEKLTADGGAPSMCGWLKDKFGLSWQVVPTQIGELMSGGAEASGRVMQAVMQMQKLDLQKMKDAYQGK